MQPWEKLSISGAKKLGFRVEQRDVYKQEGPIENYHLFFEDNASNDFPIVLLGKWELDESTLLLIGAIIQKYTQYPDTCIFITRDDSDIYLIQLYQKIKISDLPLIYTKPAHSTASILWKQILENETWKDITGNLQRDTNKSVNDVL